MDEVLARLRILEQRIGGVAGVGAVVEEHARIEIRGGAGIDERCRQRGECGRVAGRASPAAAIHLHPRLQRPVEPLERGGRGEAGESGRQAERERGRRRREMRVGRVEQRRDEGIRRIVGDERRGCGRHGHVDRDGNRILVACHQHHEERIRLHRLREAARGILLLRRQGGSGPDHVQQVVGAANRGIVLGPEIAAECATPGIQRALEQLGDEARV